MVNDAERSPIFVSYVAEASIYFMKTLYQLCLKQCDVKLIFLRRTKEMGHYFQLKSVTLFASIHKCRLQIYLF